MPLGEPWLTVAAALARSARASSPPYMFYLIGDFSKCALFLLLLDGDLLARESALPARYICAVSFLLPVSVCILSGCTFRKSCSRFLAFF